LITFFKRSDKMYVDVTPQFKKAVEAIEERKEELGLVVPPKDKSRILASGSPLVKQAANIVNHVGQLGKVLGEQKKGYLQAHGGISDNERDQVDSAADNISRQCRQLINNFKAEVSRLQSNQSAIEHYNKVGDGLESYLKSVVSVHSEMKAVRVARDHRQKRLSRLEVHSVQSRSQQIGKGQGSQGDPVPGLQEQARAAASARTAQGSHQQGYSTDEEEELSPEEAQAMEMENERLMEQLSSLTNQVEQVQSKVVKVAELQAVFTEKVLEQADLIEHVHSEAVTATENTKGGNEAVRAAIQNKASYRVYILFILLVFSFSLLFLDWYND